MAPEAFTRRVGVALALCCLLAACAPQDGERVSAAWTIEPASPTTGGETIVRVALQDARRQLVRGARLRLEGHMAHPGMAPVIGTIRERADGEYEGRLSFSMAGDWVVVVTGELPNGTRIVRQLEVDDVEDTTRD